MARRSEHSLDQIKSMALQAAQNIVAEQGFKALTVRKVAVDIGYSAGSIYMLFDNMDDLIMHLNARTLAQLASRLQTAIEGEADAGQVLMKLALEYVQFAREHYHAWSMIFEHQPASGQALPLWYQQRIDSVFAYVQNAFKALQPGCSDTAIIRAARAFWGGVHGICILSLTGKLDVVSHDPLEATVLLLASSFIRGWRDADPEDFSASVTTATMSR